MGPASVIPCLTSSRSRAVDTLQLVQTEIKHTPYQHQTLSQSPEPDLAMATGPDPETFNVGSTGLPDLQVGIAVRSRLDISTRDRTVSY